MLSGFEGLAPAQRRRPPGPRPHVEPLEGRQLLASLGDFEAAAGSLSASLAPYSDSGFSASDGVTNVSRPTFTGQAARWANVQVFAVGSSWPTETRPLGQTIAGMDGSWTIQSAHLPDGVYTVTAVETPPTGSPGQPVVVVPALTIDTIAPRIHGAAFNPGNGTVTVVISDVGAGVDKESAETQENYTVVPPTTIIGRHPAPGGGPIVSPAISGFYSDASAYTVQLDFREGGARGWPRGRYRFQVRSGGVIDQAGNALDGEFTGSLPSGDGVAGGNFIVDLFNRQAGRRPARPRPTRA
jgi:hypothetical protein